MTTHVTRRFVPEPCAVAAARRVCMDVAERLDPALCQPLALLVSELVSDSVQHLGGRPDASIRVDLHSSGSTLRVEVSGPDERFQRVDDPVDLLRAGGRSLLVVDALADDWGFGHESEAGVWFELHAL